MFPNINAGLGRLLGDGLFGSTGLPTTGHVFMVGPSSLAAYNEISAMYGNYADGKPVLYTTIALAVAQCVAARGDIILLLPGHTESISTATALTMSISGVTVIGLGVGSSRAVITLDTANTATINVTANGVAFKNVVFVANFLNVAALFTLTAAADFQLLNCEVRDTDTTHNFVAMIVTNTTSNNADGLVIDSCKFYLLIATGATKLVSALGTNNRWTIRNNYYSTPTTNAGAVIPIAAGKVLTGLLLSNNLFNLVNAAGTATGLLITTNGSTNTGYVNDNRIQVATTTPLGITAASGLVQTNNLYTHTADKSGYVMPVIDASS